MVEFFQDFYKNIVAFDLIYLIITLYSVIRCSSKGFVLSLLAAAKWLLAYIITLILFPRVKPYVDNIVDNEYVLDLILGVGIFVIVIFLVLMINKGISKAVKYTGLGKLDTVFGFFFGFSILVFSNFIPTIYFGVFTGIAMLLAMISVLTLLPRLLLIIKPFGTQID